MKKTLVILLVVFGAINFANAKSLAPSYSVSDSEISQQMDAATEISPEAYTKAAPMSETKSTVKSKKSAGIATLICWAVGGLGIHRHYLGTSSNMWAIYTFTCCGIVGIVPTIDFFVLLIDGVINDNIDSYVDNEDFFMW